MDQDDGCIYLPPGFRFHPMDEEIITHYLWEKVMDSSFNARAIGEVDLNKSEPWDLPSKAKMGEKEWYFFCQRDRKYPTGMRTNRATEAGYWKATGKDKEIYKGNGNLVGMKKTLVFYMGRAPKGEKTNWVMHEYRLEGKSSYHNIPRISKDEWVVCRVFHKNIETKRSSDEAFGRTNSFSVNEFLADELLDPPTLPPLVDVPRLSTSNQGQAMNFLPNFNVNHHVSMNPIATMAASSCFYSQTPPQTSFAPNYMGMGNMDYYLHQQRSRLKEEEYSCQSLQASASQDTGMSIDGNAEISSLKQDIAGNQYYDDLENLWKC